MRAEQRDGNVLKGEGLPLAGGRPPSQHTPSSDWFCPVLPVLAHTTPVAVPQFQSLQLEREMCLASNCGLARVNLSLRPRLEDGKASLAIKYQELREIREACWDKQQRLGEWGTAEGTRQSPVPRIDARA